MIERFWWGVFVTLSVIQDIVDDAVEWAMENYSCSMGVD